MNGPLLISQTVYKLFIKNFKIEIHILYVVTNKVGPLIFNMRTLQQLVHVL